LTLAALESLALLCDGKSPRPQTLARVAEIIDTELRFPAFLEQLHRVLQLLSEPWWSPAFATQTRQKGSP